MDESLSASTPAAATFTMWPFTVTHFILIGLFAAFAIYIIVRGRRLKAKRKAAEQELEDSGRGVRMEGPASPVEASVDAPEPVVEPKLVIQPEPALPAITSSEPDPAPVTPPASPPGELTRLKGLGPRAAALLTERGIATLAELAALSPEQAEQVDASLGDLAGRMTRDQWVEQAQMLNRGDIAAYEARFGKLG